MPELAEVIYFASQWKPGIGHRIVKVILHPEARVFRDIPDPGRLLVNRIQGTRYEEARTHGKQMFFRFDDVWLGGHLGMTGKLWCAPKSYEAEKHDHLVLRQAQRQLVFTDPRMFGHWQFYQQREMEDFWKKLPPEVTSRSFTKECLAAFLRRRGRRPIKAVLLMQEMFPGIGNWMADEVLWRCSLDPRRQAKTLTEAEISLLWRKLRLVSRQAIRIIGRDWGTPPDTWLFKHRWEDDGHCPCGAALRRETVGGRTTT